MIFYEKIFFKRYLVFSIRGYYNINYYIFSEFAKNILTFKKCIYGIIMVKNVFNLLQFIITIVKVDYLNVLEICVIVFV